MPADQWEYKLWHADLSGFAGPVWDDAHQTFVASNLNALGAAGWELVSVVTLSRSVALAGGTTGAVHYFRRRRCAAEAA